MAKHFDINIVVTIEDDTSLDKFINELTEFIESKNGYFGGGIMEVDEDGEPIKNET